MNTPEIVAEISANHNGSLERAFRLIQAAKNAGADAVKFQCYDPLRLAESRGGKNKKLESGLWSGWTLGDLYSAAWTPRHWFPKLFQCSKDEGIKAFSSVFDLGSIEMLEELGCPAYKISSFEIRNLDLIRAAVATGKPVAISTGMALWEEMTAAHDVAGESLWSLMHCVSAYPCPTEESDLFRIKMMQEINRNRIGFSDHTVGIEAPLAATALGVNVIEKHLTLDRNDGGLDSRFSTEPHQFRHMVKTCQTIALAMAGSRTGAGFQYQSLRVA